MITPKLLKTIKAYNFSLFYKDLFAGISIGLISLPLALAFAIASGVKPEQGLYTAIVAGFLISLLGGSRVQIGGPTGAYVVIVYSVVQKYGYEGLALATLISACLLLIMAFAKLGQWLKFIPISVIVGFTAGLALTIFMSQVKDFLGLNVAHLPPAFIERCTVLCSTLHTWNMAAFLVSITSLILIFFLRERYPKAPAAIIVVFFATVASYFFHLPIETIASKYGELPHSLPMPVFPQFDLEQVKQVFPDAVTIAILGAIESLLSAHVADKKIGARHNSNAELFGQGIANIGSVIFSGIPATGAIARTQANINLGAKTPISGITHALTLLVLLLFFAPWASQIPLAALSAVLIYVAYNMSDIGHFYQILKGDKKEAVLLIVTFLLTVLIDLAVAVEVGVILAALLFLKSMSENTRIEKIEEDLKVVYQVEGPLFYGAADILDNQEISADKPIVLDLRKATFIDGTGEQAIADFKKRARAEVLRRC